MNIKINGVDWSQYIDKYSIEPYHIKVEGPNKGMSMGGTEIFDTVKVKECFSAVIGLLTQQKYTEFIRLAKLDTVTVQYTNPDTNQGVTKEMILTTGKPTQIPGLDGQIYYKNMSVDFQER